MDVDRSGLRFRNLGFRVQLLRVWGLTVVGFRMRILGSCLDFRA